jgi:hypothetical protein
MSEYFDNVDIGEAIAQDDALREQAAITAELQASRKVASLPYNPNATEFTVPKVRSSASFSISLSGVNCPTKTLIFKALNAAFYLTFFTNTERIRDVAGKRAWRQTTRHRFTTPEASYCGCARV